MVFDIVSLRIALTYRSLTYITNFSAFHRDPLNVAVLILSCG
jgi:hypothetical protein